MSPLRKSLLALLAAVMIWIMIVTWGSVGSTGMALGLILMVSALLYQRFLNNDDPDSRDFYE